jgi:hypothetical protein
VSRPFQVSLYVNIGSRKRPRIQGIFSESRLWIDLLGPVVDFYASRAFHVSYVCEDRFGEEAKHQIVDWKVRIFG